MPTPPRGTFKDLRAWQAAMDIVEESYALTRRMPADERFGLSQQLRRSAVSIPSNIAEGHGRLHRGDFVHHLSVAIGSLREVETQVLIAARLGYVTQDEITVLIRKVDALGRMIACLIKSVRRFDIVPKP